MNKNVPLNRLRINDLRYNDFKDIYYKTYNLSSQEMFNQLKQEPEAINSRFDEFIEKFKNGDVVVEEGYQEILAKAFQSLFKGEVDIIDFYGADNKYIESVKLNLIFFHDNNF